jgi:hypothetical protein
MGLAAAAAALGSLVVAACGGTSSGTSPATGTAGTATPVASAPASSSAAGTATLSCPSAATAGAALGLTLPTPTTSSSTADSMECNYLSGTSDVLILEVKGIATSYISSAEASMAASMSSLNINFVPVSGVGDQAYSYSYAIGTSTAEGIMAAKGTTYVGIACTMTTTTLPKIEAYANQLLG